MDLRDGLTNGAAVDDLRMPRFFSAMLISLSVIVKARSVGGNKQEGKK